MAKATVVRAQPVQPPVQSVVLELSEKEAQALRNFLWNAKWPYGFRGEGDVLNDIGRSLREAGIPVEDRITS
jgi:hypothetical protein